MSHQVLLIMCITITPIAIVQKKNQNPAHRFLGEYTYVHIYKQNGHNHNPSGSRKEEIPNPS